jgi:putative heme iron utilization protein
MADSSATEIIPAAVSDRICNHMNKDHADAVLLYAQFFGQATAATAAEMLSVDAEGFNLTAEVEGQPTPVRITFAQPVQEAKEVHHVLVDMMKQAQGQAE